MNLLRVPSPYLTPRPFLSLDLSPSSDFSWPLLRASFVHCLDSFWYLCVYCLAPGAWSCPATTPSPSEGTAPRGWPLLRVAAAWAVCVGGALLLPTLRLSGHRLLCELHDQQSMQEPSSAPTLIGP